MPLASSQYAMIASANMQERSDMSRFTKLVDSEGNETFGACTRCGTFSPLAMSKDGMRVCSNCANRIESHTVLHEMDAYVLSYEYASSDLEPGMKVVWTKRTFILHNSSVEEVAYRMPPKGSLVRNISLVPCHVVAKEQ